MQDKVLYSEKRASIGITIILGIVTVLMVAYLIGQLLLGPIGSKPAPTWVIATITLFIILVTINFRRILLTLTEEGVNVQYGIIKTSLSWDDIVKCEIDEKNYFYGWGIRFGKYKKKWVWIYNVIGGPRVAFLTEKNKPKGLIISSGRPDDIVEIATKRISEKNK